MASPEENGPPPSIAMEFPPSLTHFMLVVVGEPLQQDYIDLILADIEKGNDVESKLSVAVDVICNMRVELCVDVDCCITVMDAAHITNANICIFTACISDCNSSLWLMLQWAA